MEVYSDGDGVRDDVERHIASLNKSQEIKDSLKEFSRINQNGIENSNSRTDSIQSTYDRPSYEYCLKSQMTEAEVEELTKELTIRHHNTKEGILAWARS